MTTLSILSVVTKSVATIAEQTAKLFKNSHDVDGEVKDDVLLLTSGS